MKRILPDMKTGLRDDGGQALVITVLAMTVLMGFVGLAIDVGNLRSAERKLQQAADAAALAGAIEINYCSSYSSTSTGCPEMKTAASTAVTENGLSTPTVKTNQCTTPSITGATLVVNWGPCLLGSVSADPNYGSQGVVEAQVGQLYPVYFAGLLGITNPVPITVRAEAGRAANPNCLLVDTIDYGKTGTGSLVLPQGSHVYLSCGIGDDGQLQSHNGAQMSGTTQFTVNATGSNCKGSQQFNISPTCGAPQIPDPICASYSTTSNTPFDTTSTCRSATSTYNEPTCSSSAWQTQAGSYSGGTLSAGCYAAPTSGCTPATVSSGNTYDINTYCDALNLSGDVTLNPGVYVFNGDLDLNGHNITGTGVTLYFVGGSIINGNGSRVTMHAPTDSTTPATGVGETAKGSYEGMLIWQAPSDANAMMLASGSQSVWDGMVYIPGGTLDLSDGANASSGCTNSNYSIIDAKNVVDMSGAKVFNQCFNFSTLAGGDPIKSQIAVLVE